MLTLSSLNHKTYNHEITFIITYFADYCLAVLQR